MRALLDDELAAHGPAIAAARRADTLTPMLDLAESLVTLQALEVTATGTNERVGPILTDLGERARGLIDRDLRARRGRVWAIRRAADQVVTTTGPFWWQDGVARRGLHTPDRRELRDLIGYVGRVEQVARLGQQYAWQLGRDGTPWEPVITDCRSVIGLAESVLDAG